ncbi:hypothetical protein D9758_009446 [Tetrapyrgos nigripes]|uniref:Uncharacterized protein n=1 Tax=Tetrapyrgos nigripes TaxID=182062 RepID=A0A8H5FWS9_9AGAR|nr:hypothetical protein D9758_009446 [Tetrapyrgos nigripes]
MGIFAGYGQHILYSTAITSLSIHLLYQRRHFEDQRAAVQARISVLESIVQELRSNKNLSPDDLARLKRLARPPEEKEEEEDLSWREVFSGKVGKKDSPPYTLGIKKHNLDYVVPEIYLSFCQICVYH